VVFRRDNQPPAEPSSSRKSRWNCTPQFCELWPFVSPPHE